MSKKCNDIEIKRQYATHAIKWCRDNMGVNPRRKNLPKVSVRINFRKDETERFIKGIYYSSENRIIVYHANCCSIEDVVSTIIHEYTHYLQSMKKYWEYFDTHNYSTHPYERQARRNELKHTSVCIKQIKKYL
jgi:hypothetical protein